MVDRSCMIPVSFPITNIAHFNLTIAKLPLFYKAGAKRRNREPAAGLARGGIRPTSLPPAQPVEDGVEELVTAGEACRTRNKRPGIGLDKDIRHKVVVAFPCKNRE